MDTAQNTGTAGLRFHLEVFDGPLDLLLTLIAKNKVEITDIPIAVILEQYLEQLDAMRENEMEVSGEFIVMAAELMRIKSKMLLPREEKEEEDPRTDLARALLEYKAAKEHAALLRERYASFAGRIVKDTAVIDTSADVPSGLQPGALSAAMARVLERSRSLPQLARRSEQAIRALLEKKIVPVGEKIWTILRILWKEGTTSFEDLMLRASSRSELVALFLALLELMRAGRVTVSFPPEDKPLDPILLTLNREKKTISEEPHDGQS